MLRERIPEQGRIDLAQVVPIVSRIRRERDDRSRRGIHDDAARLAARVPLVQIGDIVFKPRLHLRLDRGHEVALAHILRVDEQIAHVGEELCEEIFVQRIFRARENPVVRGFETGLTDERVPRAVGDDADRLRGERAAGVVAPALAQDLHARDGARGERTPLVVGKAVRDLDIHLALLRGGGKKGVVFEH